MSSSHRSWDLGDVRVHRWGRGLADSCDSLNSPRLGRPLVVEAGSVVFGGRGPRGDHAGSRRERRDRGVGADARRADGVVRYVRCAGAVQGPPGGAVAQAQVSMSGRPVRDRAVRHLNSTQRHEGRWRTPISAIAPHKCPLTCLIVLAWVAVITVCKFGSRSADACVRRASAFGDVGPALPVPITSLCRQARLDSARRHHTPLISEEPDLALRLLLG